MKLAVFLLALPLFGQSIPFPGPGMVHTASSSTYLHSRTLTVDHTKVPSTDQTSFPVMFRSPVGTVNTVTTAVTLATGDQFPTWMDSIDIAGTTYTFTRTNGTTGVLGSSAGTQTGAAYSGTPYLKTVANGGLVQNTATQINGGWSITVPADAIVTSDSGCTTKLANEWETYSATTGAAVFWYVQTLSHTSDTVAYNCYDATSVTTYQGDVNGVWSPASFVGVWHTPDGTTTTFNDSTVNAVTGTNQSTTATAGQIDGGVAFASAGSQFWNLGDRSIYTFSNGSSDTPFTISMWVNLTDKTQSQSTIAKYNGFPDAEYGFAFVAPALWCIEVDSTSSAYIARIYSTFQTDSSSATWYHIACTYDGSGTTAGTKIYINGVEKDDMNSSTGSYVTMRDTSNPLYVGHSDGLSGGFFNGIMDETRIAGAVRSGDWLVSEFNNQGSPFTFITVGSQI